MIKDLFEKFKASSGVSIDSRSIREGEMFFALKGPNFNGHSYISSAIANGAGVVVIDEPDCSLEGVTFLVDDVEAALHNLARYYRSTLRIPFIGLTGSNGKTTTKELIHKVLNKKFNTFSTKGNLNNHLGVPLSILSIKDFHEVAVIEMGANHPGEIKFLSELCMPDIGLITNIGKAHLEGFINIEGVRKAKTELFDYINKVGGILFYNKDDRNLVKSINDNMQSIGYSSSHVKIINGFSFLSLSYNESRIETKLTGRYNVYNVLAAIKIGEFFKIKLEDIISGLENYSPDNNRSEIRQTKYNQLILDSYNANPSSMKVSIENLADGEESHDKVLIIGHMLELGQSSREEHQKLVDYIESFHWEHILLIGSEFETVNLSAQSKYFKTTDSASEYIKTLSLKNKTILLKGSRGVKLEVLIEVL